MNRKIYCLCVTAGVLGLAGCGPREEQQIIVQQQPTPQVIEKTTIKPVPQNKTIVVQPPRPAPAAKTSTKVDVNLAPAPTPSVTASNKLPAPAPKPTAKPKTTAAPVSRSVTRPTPTATVVRPKPTVIPRPTPTPRPTPLASRPSGRNAPLIVRAEIVSASKVPDPKKVAYKDSIVFFKYKVLSVQSGTYTEKEVLAAHWGMKNKKLLPAARYQVGQVQTLQLDPLDKHPEVESLQRNDDTGEFDLEPFWVKSVS